MSEIEIGILGLCAIFVLLALRVPIAITLCGVSFAGVYAILGGRAAFGMLRNIPYESTAHWTLSAIPMFLLMGAVAFNSGMVTALYGAARVWLGGLPGGLAIASNFACAGFAAASGSSVATATAMGRIATPEMLRFGYEPGLATGVVAAAGTLGSLIPPSILMVLYGTFAEVSISKLMIAGIVPGMLTAVVYAAMIVIRCTLNPSLAPAAGIAPTWRERFDVLLQIWPLPVLIIGVIGGLYSGLVTATEAGALGAFLSFVIAALMGKLNWAVFKASVANAIHGTAVIFFITIGAILLSRFIALSGIPAAMGGFAEAYSLNGIMIVVFCGVVFLIMGMFLDPVGLMLTTLPVMLPLMHASGYDLIWFGILVIKFVEIGLITPPVGLSVYAIKSAVGSSVSLQRIFVGVMWFILCELLVVVLLVAFPSISLFLPNFMNN